MEKPKYLPIDRLFKKIDEPHRSQCWKIYLDNLKLFCEAAGSSHNHQNWRGGYLDHVVESMNIAVLFYNRLGSARPLAFSLSDTLLICFLHDLEKPFHWQTLYYNSGVPVRRALWHTKEERKAFREQKLAEYGIKLTPEQANAMRYVEGEGADYTNERRVMNELAAFCHLCDIWSARGWHSYPLAENDSWAGAKRSGG